VPPNSKTPGSKASRAKTSGLKNSRSKTSRLSKEKPLLAVLAGGNGAGKSTFYKLYLKPRGIPFINADEIARSVWPDDAEARSYEAMQLAETARKQALVKQRSFCFETVFSHTSKLEFLLQAKKRGFNIHLYIIHLAMPELNVGRVAQRVHLGGHSVPTDKIISRIPRTLENLQHAISLCDQVLLLDNSQLASPYVRQALYRNNKWVELAVPLESWAREFIVS
jgi:predicted ABC-type ATPase